MIVCICNGLKDKDIEDICDSCKTRQEFTDCIKKRMSRKSCHSCYHQLIQSFENKNEVAE